MLGITIIFPCAENDEWMSFAPIRDLTTGRRIFLRFRFSIQPSEFLRRESRGTSLSPMSALFPVLAAETTTVQPLCLAACGPPSQGLVTKQNRRDIYRCEKMHSSNTV